MPLSRLVNRGLRNHKLESICAHLKIPYMGAHRATPDAQMAGQAFFTMRRRMHDLWRTEFGGSQTPGAQQTLATAR